MLFIISIVSIKAANCFLLINAYNLALAYFNVESIPSLNRVCPIN